MIRIENAADHPDALVQVGRWHWDEWGAADPDGSVEAWTRRLQAKANRDRIPLTLLAYDERRLVGAVSLIDHDMRNKADVAELTPWIAGTYVAAPERGRGIGTALMEEAAKTAARLGIDRIYLYTEAAAGFYAHLGWRRELETSYEGELVTVMSLDIARS